jgi:hypothetical protein
MRKFLLTVMLGALFLLANRDAHAQVYDLYYYWDGAQYQQYWPQQDLYSSGYVSGYPEQLYDPYYQLHVLHYQLYLPQNQIYSYPSCCFGGTTVVVPSPVAPFRRGPRATGRGLRPLSLPPLPPAVTSSAPPIRIR